MAKVAWTEKVVAVLADLEWHSIDELHEAAGPFVPPGRAARAAEENRARFAPGRPRVRPVDEVAVGRRFLVHRSVVSLRKAGRITVADGMARLDDRPARVERALRDLVEATGRLEHGDASGDVLFGVLDMRTRACTVLGIEAGA